MKHLSLWLALLALDIMTTTAYGYYEWDGPTSWEGMRNWEHSLAPNYSGDNECYWKPGQAHAGAGASYSEGQASSWAKGYAQAHGVRLLKWAPEPGKQLPGPGDTYTATASGAWETEQIVDPPKGSGVCESEVNVAASLGTASYDPDFDVLIDYGDPDFDPPPTSVQESANFTLVNVYGPTTGGEVNIYYAAFAYAARQFGNTAKARANIHGSGPS